jgi:hypothetical protein
MKNFVLIIALFLILMTATVSQAIPTLQLDIAGGTYNMDTETIVASSNPFTLYALLNRNSSNTLNDYYYISAAVSPKTGPDDVNLGSFTFAGQTIRVTEDMTYGTPPIETYLGDSATKDPGDLRPHGVFPTYFYEFDFQFSSTNKAVAYNSQDDVGAGPTPSSVGSFFYQAFTVDTSLLDPNYVIHFDLYNTALARRSSTDLDVTQFAPFSHDAESGHKVPEPVTLLLLGSGLLGLGFFARKRN